ncbi:MAG: DUF302 domain-containing protein [Halodesulfurarchaeum sp.]|nr:DUF302 domain-containing protein [Halodesulfurarchaeum sp.]
MTYTLQTTIDAPFEDVLDAVTTALGNVGFGVLSDIDVQTTFSEKLDVEMDRYRILGACNPPLAHEGISAETDLGSLLPCNVAIYETETGAVVVSAVDPDQLLSLPDNPALEPIAADVKERLERVLAAVDDRFASA